MLLGVLAALLVLAPLLGHGVALAYDLVIPPGRQPLRPSDLGLGTGLPRAVPQDAVVAALTTVIPGWLLQRLVLGGTLVAAAVGAARVVPTTSTLGRCAAALVYVWNPYVAERLLIGHWGLLVGYAALPWVLRHALGVRAARPGAVPRLLLAVAVASVTPTGGVLAVATAVAVSGRPGIRLGGILLVLQGPWLVPALLHPAGATSDAAGVAAFAARSENWSGVTGTVLGLGGIWNAQVVPGSRTTVVAPLLTAALLALAAVGLPALYRRFGGAAAAGLTGLAAAGVLIALAAAIPGGEVVLRWGVTTLPGGGLLRDAQKWLAPLALLLAVASGLGVERLLAHRRTQLLAVLGLLLPLAMVPDLAFGGDGRLRPVDYPKDWSTVAAALAAHGGSGDLVSLPFSAYRAYEWNGNRPALDPAPRWFDVPVVVDDSLRVGGVVVRGEDERARQVAQAIEAGRPLGQIGVRWILVQHRTPGEVPATATRSADLVQDGPDLSLWRVRDVVPVRRSHPPFVPVLLADAAALAAVLGSGWRLVPLRRGSVAPVDTVTS